MVHVMMTQLMTAVNQQLSVFSWKCKLIRWVTIMDIRLQPLILGPDRPQLRRTIPECFQIPFGDKVHVAVMIDCFEEFIERSSNFLVRACT